MIESSGGGTRKEAEDAADDGGIFVGDIVLHFASPIAGTMADDGGVALGDAFGKFISTSSYCTKLA